MVSWCKFSPEMRTHLGPQGVHMRGVPQRHSDCLKTVLSVRNHVMKNEGSSKKGQKGLPNIYCPLRGLATVRTRSSIAQDIRCAPGTAEGGARVGKPPVNEGHPGGVGLADHAEPMWRDERGSEVGERRVAARQRSRTKSAGEVVHSVWLIRVIISTLSHLHRPYGIVVSVSARFSQPSPITVLT